jgi:hypothetical protein
MPDMIHDLQVRGARRQSLFREINARVAELDAGSLQTTKIDFVCECWEEDCFVPVTLRRDDYLSVRAEPAQFVVAPDHVDLLIETVVAKHPGYWIVEKIDAGRAVALALAPSTSLDAA